MCIKKLTMFHINKNIKEPAFKKGDIVVLTRKYTPYTSTDPYYLQNPYLKEGAFGVVEECCLSLYPNDFDQVTCEWSTITDGKEWCYVRLFTPKADYDNDTTYIEAVDLRLFKFQ